MGSAHWVSQGASVAVGRSEVTAGWPQAHCSHNPSSLGWSWVNLRILGVLFYFVFVYNGKSCCEQHVIMLFELLCEMGDGKDLIFCFQERKSA